MPKNRSRVHHSRDQPWTGSYHTELSWERKADSGYAEVASISLLYSFWPSLLQKGLQMELQMHGLEDFCHSTLPRHRKLPHKSHLSLGNTPNRFHTPHQSKKQQEVTAPSQCVINSERRQINQSTQERGDVEQTGADSLRQKLLVHRRCFCEKCQKAWGWVSRHGTTKNGDSGAL